MCQESVGLGDLNINGKNYIGLSNFPFLHFRKINTTVMSTIKEQV